MGYGVSRSARKALILTKEGGKPRKYDGKKRMLPIGEGLDAPELIRMKRTSANAIEWSRRCEAVCLGKPDPYAGVPTPEEVDSRVQSGVKAVLESMGLTPELIASMKAKSEPPPQPLEPKAPPANAREGVPSRSVDDPLVIDESYAAAEAAADAARAAAKRKGGRPKGSKNKPKVQAEPAA